MNEAASSLVSLQPGGTAVIVEVQVSAEGRSRLLELGLVPGTVVQLVRFAPLGDPVEIRVRGYHLTIRRHEAELILVRPESPVQAS